METDAEVPIASLKPHFANTQSLLKSQPMSIHFYIHCLCLTTATGVYIYAGRLKKAMLLHGVQAVLGVAIIKLALCVDGKRNTVHRMLNPFPQL